MTREEFDEKHRAWQRKRQYATAALTGYCDALTDHERAVGMAVDVAEKLEAALPEPKFYE